MKTPASPEGKTSARDHNDSNVLASFLGTDNPRHLRVIHAVWVRPIPREQLDQVAGSSNGPELVAELRRRGLKMRCERTKKKDCDLFDCYPGVYHLTDSDRRKLNAWNRGRASKGQA